MRQIKDILAGTLIIVVMSSFSQCSSAQVLQEKAPVAFGDVYCQSWVAGIEGGGAGLNIFIPTEDTSITLEQVYFRGKIVDLETRKGVYIGRFKSNINQPKEILLDSGNSEKTEKITEEVEEVKLPFDIKDNQCVVSYKEGKKTKYYMIDNVIQKQALNHY